MQESFTKENTEKKLIYSVHSYYISVESEAKKTALE